MWNWPTGNIEIIRMAIVYGGCLMTEQNLNGETLKLDSGYVLRLLLFLKENILHVGR